LLGHLRLGQLDLLVHEQRRALGDLRDRRGDVLRRVGALAVGRRRGGGRAHSGGSSSNRRLHAIPAARWATMLDSALRPASRPDQISLLTISFSITAAVYCPWWSPR